MLQHASVDMLGIIGNIKKLNKQGTQVALYVNYIDDYGNSTRSDLFSITMFHEAEKALLRNNPQKGDQLYIRGGSLVLRKENGSTYPNVICNYGSQVLVIGVENHQTMVHRESSLQQSHPYQ